MAISFGYHNINRSFGFEKTWDCDFIVTPAKICRRHHVWNGRDNNESKRTIGSLTFILESIKIELNEMSEGNMV